jgi:hypothetical protein
MKLSREQAIKEVGLNFVEQVESMNCDFSGRATNDGTVEFIATVNAGQDEDGFKRTISAYYVHDADAVDATDDISDLDWVVDHYTVQ